MKKIFAALLVTALVLTLAACHLSENEDAPITQTREDFFTQPTTTVPVQDDTLVGAWNCKLIVDSRKMELEGVDASLECYIDAEFREDMTYSITIDQDALQASVEQFVADVQEDLVQAAYQQYLQQGLTEEQVDAMIQDQLGMTLQEGKFHQVKRMLAFCGKPVVYLKRLSMGPLWLDESLQPGEFRHLTGEEEKLLRA